MNRELDPISGRAIAVGIEIGLFEAILEGRHSLESIVQATSCSQRGLSALLNLLVSIDIVRVDLEGYYSLPVRTPRYLALEWPDKWKALPEIPQYSELAKAVRTGKPVGVAIESEESAGSFFAPIVPSLFERHLPQAQELAKRIPLKVKKVLDLGCGTAVWSIPLASTRPGASFVGVDRKLMLDQVTSGFLASRGLRSKFQLIAQDYHKVSFPKEEFDVIILGQILHADGWERSLSLLGKVNQWLKPDGLVIIAEIIASEPRKLNYEANVFNLMMLMLTEQGVVFSASELEAMLVRSGFLGIEWIEGSGEYPLLKAGKV